MHFIIEYKTLLKIKKLLVLTSSSINLNNKGESILISTENKTLNFFVNNGLTSCKLIIDDESTQIFKEHKLFVNSKIFLSLIENLKDHSSIEFISQENDLLEISSEKFSCNLICTSDNDFVVEDFKTDNNFQRIKFDYNTLKIINNRFKEFAKQISVNLNKNSLLTNINFKNDTNVNQLYITSTDSYRIIFGIFDHISEPFNINLPPVTLNNIVNLFSEFENEQIEFFIQNEVFVIKTDNLLFKSNLFIGNYPNFNDWFYTKPQFSLELSKNKLISALERTLLFCSTYVKTTLCQLVGDKLYLEYKDSEKGFSKEELDVVNIQQQNIDFSLNSQLLKMLIKNIPSETLVINLTESLKPIVVYGKNNDDNFKQIILPLKGS